MSVRKLIPYQDWAKYDPETGSVWRQDRAGVWYEARGTVDSHGYVVFNRRHKLHKAHRIAWVAVHGSAASLDIDHINGNKQDNRISNLRECCRSDNNANQHKPRHKLYSAVKGVTYDKSRGKFMGHVTYKGRVHSRRFSTEVEAIEFVLATREVLHGEYAKA